MGLIFPTARPAVQSSNVGVDEGLNAGKTSTFDWVKRCGFAPGRAITLIGYGNRQNVPIGLA
jgi:hypothetical protein